MALLVLALQGCGAIGYDHRDKIASAILFRSNGDLDEKAFASALNDKFANELWPQAALKSFAETLGGACTDGLLDRMSCSIPRSGSYCMSSRIEIDASMSAGQFRVTKVTTRHLGC